MSESERSPVPIEPCPLQLGSEESMLEEAVFWAERHPGDRILVFPEYLALHPDASEQAVAVLTDLAKRHHQAYLTTLNLPGTWLPETEPSLWYNTAVLVGPSGVSALGAKISPQSFEMWHLDPTSPEIGVAPYHVFWRVPVAAGGVTFTAMVTVCSDLLYLVTGTDGLSEHVSDVLWVPANFGRGAEAGARAIGRLAAWAGWFREVVVVNPGQAARPGRKPLTRAMRDRFRESPEGSTASVEDVWEERMRITREHLVLVPDQVVPSFRTMADWTDTPQGRIMMPASRAMIVPAIRDWPGAPVVAF